MRRRGSGGQVFVDDQHRGAAVWAAPGEWKAGVIDVLRLMPVSIPLFGRNLVRGLRALGALERSHPSEPHWYLEFVGTHPDHQGTGIGSALVRAVTDRCDSEGLPAYLESSKESNVPFYARHGFEVRDEIHLPSGGPTLWPMWREPKG